MATTEYFREHDTVAEIQRQMAERFRGAATIIVNSPRVGEASCSAAVAYGEGKYGREFPFVIGGRSATEVSNDLAAQIVRWMGTGEPR